MSANARAKAGAHRHGEEKTVLPYCLAGDEPARYFLKPYTYALTRWQPSQIWLLPPAIDSATRRSAPILARRARVGMLSLFLWNGMSFQDACPGMFLATHKSSSQIINQ